MLKLMILVAVFSSVLFANVPQITSLYVEMDSLRIINNIRTYDTINASPISVDTLSDITWRGTIVFSCADADSDTLGVLMNVVVGSDTLPVEGVVGSVTTLPGNGLRRGFIFRHVFRNWTGSVDARIGITLDDTLVPADVPHPSCYDISKMPKPVINAVEYEPFEIMDGIYYVGNTQVSCHLITTEDGLILLDATMPHEVNWLLNSIRRIGFNPADVKVVIATHAAVDHSGGCWYFQRYFGSQIWLHQNDIQAARDAACLNGQWVDIAKIEMSSAYPPFEADHQIVDGDTAVWGGRTFIFHLTPMATPGTITIETHCRDGENNLVKSALLGGIAPREDNWREPVERLKTGGYELWLGAHPDQNDTFAKADRLKLGETPNPFIDPVGWQAFLNKILSLNVP